MRRKMFGGLVLLAILVWAIVWLSSCPPAKIDPVRVTYQVSGKSGCTSASITYENKSGGTEQRTVNLPWRTSFEAMPGQWLYLSAQNEQAHGYITVKIMEAGEYVEEAQSQGGYAIASCSRSVGE